MTFYGVSKVNSAEKPKRKSVEKSEFVEKTAGKQPAESTSSSTKEKKPNRATRFLFPKEPKKQVNLVHLNTILHCAYTKFDTSTYTFIL